MPLKTPLFRTRLTSAIALSLVLAACGDSQEGTAPLSAQHLEQAEAYMLQGQYRAAMIEARNAIQKSPESAEGHIKLAGIFNQLAQGKNAIAQLQQVPEDQQNTAAYQETLITAYLTRNKFLSAQKALDNSATLRDTTPTSFHLLQAKTHEGLGNLDKAVQTYHQVIALDANSEQALIGLTKTQMRKNNFHQAFETLARLEQIAPQSPEVLLLKAGMAFNDQDLDKTESLLTKAITQLPNADVTTPLKAKILSSLAEVLTLQGRTAEALIYTKLLAEAFPGADAANSTLREAQKLFSEQKLDEAQRKLTELLEIAPGLDDAAQLLAVILYQKGDYEKANEYFTKHLDPEIASQKITNIAALTSLQLRNPEKVLALLEYQIDSTNNPEILSIYGIAALAAQKYEAGESALLKAIELAPAQIRNRLALAEYYNRGPQPAPEKALEQLTTAYRQNDGNPYAQAALAMQYFRLDQPHKAKKLVEEIIHKYPDAFTSHLTAGDLYRALGQPATAAKYYQSAAGLNPEDPRALINLGQARLAQKDSEGARDTYRQLIERFPDNLIGYRGLITAHEQLGDIRQILEELENLANSSEDAAPAAVLAEYFAYHAQFDRSREFEQLAIQKAGDANHFKFLRARIARLHGRHALQNGDYDSAKSAALRGLSVTPNAIELLTLLAEAEISTANYPEADKIIARINDLDTATADHLKGDWHRAQKQASQATKAYRKAWQSAPSDSVAAKLFAALKFQDSAQATQFLSDWLDTYPDSPRALLARSEGYLNKSQYTEAIADLEQALKYQPGSPVLLNNLAWAYHKTGDNRAETTAGKAYNLAPQVAAIADTYGWILFKNGKQSQALPILQKAAENAPDSEDIKAHLKMALENR